MLPSPSRSRRKRFAAAALLAPCLVASTAVADEGDLARYASLFPNGRHLVEFSYTYLDTDFGGVDVWLPRYTFAYSTSLRMAASAGYIHTDPDDPLARSESGPTDSELLLQYDPSANLTANAFVPDTVGLTFALQVPTGDHDKGIGDDLWAATLGAGWLVDFPWNFWLLPSLQYTRSFEEARGVERQHRADLGLGLYWLFNFKGWLGVEPVIGRDMERDTTANDWSIVIGKAFDSGWAVDLRWSRVENLDPAARRDDRTVFVGLTYQFGPPPRGYVPQSLDE